MIPVGPGIFCPVGPVGKLVMPSQGKIMRTMKVLRGTRAQENKCWSQERDTSNIRLYHIQLPSGYLTKPWKMSIYR